MAISQLELFLNASGKIAGRGDGVWLWWVCVETTIIFLQRVTCSVEISHFFFIVLQCFEVYHL